MPLDIAYSFVVATVVGQCKPFNDKILPLQRHFKPTNSHLTSFPVTPTTEKERSTQKHYKYACKEVPVVYVYSTFISLASVASTNMYSGLVRKQLKV